MAIGQQNIPDVIRSLIKNKKILINPNFNRPLAISLGAIKGIFILAKKQFENQKICWGMNFGTNPNVTDAKTIVQYIIDFWGLAK